MFSLKLGKVPLVCTTLILIYMQELISTFPLGEDQNFALSIPKRYISSALSRRTSVLRPTRHLDVFLQKTCQIRPGFTYKTKSSILGSSVQKPVQKCGCQQTLDWQQCSSWSAVVLILFILQCTPMMLFLTSWDIKGVLKDVFADNLLTPMSSKMSMSFFLLSKRNLAF